MKVSPLYQSKNATGNYANQTLTITVALANGVKQTKLFQHCFCYT